MEWIKLVKDLNKSKNWPKILWGMFLIIAGISLWKLFNPNPVFTHDNNYGYWLSAFDNIIRSGQLFPSWVKSFWFEHGSPLFIFYPPLFFYLAEIPRLLGASLVVAIKITVGLSFIASFFTMYLLAKEIWGKWSGLFAGLIYMTAPYHFVLIYIRGAYAENLAYALFPLGLWFVYKIFQSNKDIKYIIGLSLTTALIILTNVPSTVLYGILALLWIIILFIYQKRIPLISLIVGFLGSAGLAAFYWLPAFLNKGLVQSNFFFSNEFIFSNYFVSFTQCLSNLIQSKADFFQWGISFWIIILLSIIYLYQKSKKQIEESNKLIWLLLFSLAIVVILMNKLSYILWDSSVVIRYIQFPYRLLSLVCIFVSMLGAYVTYRVVGLGRLTLFLLIIIQAVAFSNFAVGFRDDIYRQDSTYTVYGDIKAQLIIAPKEKRNASGFPKFVKTHTAEDGYLPINVDPEEIKMEFVRIAFNSLPPISLQATARYTIPDSEKIITEGVVSNIVEDIKSINFTHYHSGVSRIHYVQSGFPGWQVLIDGKQVEWESPNGKISFIIPAGQHNVEIKYAHPPGAVTGRTISVFFFIVIIMIIVWRRKPVLKSKKETLHPKSKQ